jgi:RNA polymerase sigma-70 factor (ECF subfamily)
MNDVHQLGPLLERCRAGDGAALNALLEKIRPYVRLLVRPRLGPDLCRKLDASDLVQESLLRIYRGFGQFDGAGVPQLLAWVGQIVGNVVVTSERHHGADKRDLRREVHGEELLARWLAGGSGPDERAQRDEQAARLAAALERLPEVYREVIQARFFDGVPFADLAARLGRSAGAVRVLCLRAVERLRREMETPS